MRTIQTITGIIILLFQVFMIVRARYDESRHFCWAPHDRQITYQLSVDVNGQTLNQQQIKKRYRIKTGKYWKGDTFIQLFIDPRSIEHIKSIISQYELTYGRKDNATIMMTYQTNGGEKKYWQWPHK